VSRIRKLVLINLIAAAAASVAAAQTDYSKLDLATLQQKASGGDVGAEQQLGSDYANGLGVPRDYGQALTWYRKAADRGAAFSQNQLGYMYQKGLGVVLDYDQAVIWYRKAADQGRAEAQNNLGIMYQKGWGVAQDYAQALSWYTKAAEQGNPGAQENLGALYQNGLGVTPDLAQARVWYQKAADQGNAAAKSALVKLDLAAPVEKAADTAPKPTPPKPTPPPTPTPAKSRVLSKQEVLDLLKDLDPKRVGTLVSSRGVSFSLNPATEKELRAAGADDELLVAIATHKK